MSPPGLNPAPKSRRGGRIVARLPGSWRRYPWYRDVGGCVICHDKYRQVSEENGHVFCYIHDPDRAEKLLANAPSFLTMPQREIPPRRVLKRIMRLSGRERSPHKPPRPKKRSRDRAYVR